MSEYPYVIEKTGISIASAALDEIFGVSKPGFLTSIWIRLTSAAPVGGLNVTVNVVNDLGFEKLIRDIDIPAGETDLIIFYGNNKGYPLVEHNLSTGGVTKDKIQVKTGAAHAGNTVHIEIICI